MRIVCKPAFFLFVVLFVLSCGTVLAQSKNRIQDIVVEGARQASPSLVIIQSGLQTGGSLSADNASEAVRKLWSLGIFSDVRILTDEMDNGVRVVIRVLELPAINSISLRGFKEFKEQEIINAITIAKNKAIGDVSVAKMKHQILDMYSEKGFLLAAVAFTLTPVPGDSSRVDVLISADEGKKVKIKHVAFEGNENVSSSKLKKQMEIKEDRWYRSGEYKKESMEKDREAIVRFYKAQGYRDAAVFGDSLVVDPKNSDITLLLRVAEGQKYVFGKTLIEGNTVFTTEKLLPFVSYTDGDTFNEDLITMAFYQMLTTYQDAGYLNVAIDRVQEAHGDTVDVRYDIAEGTTAKIAKVIIEGNTKTIDKVVRREIELFPGESFSRTKFEESARKIRMLNYFAKDETGVVPNYTFAENGKDVNLIFKVKEAQTGMASVGGGYSERDKLVGTLSLSNTNLFGRGQTLNFSWEMGSRRKSFDLGFTEPWLFDTKTSFSADIYDIDRSDYTSAFDEELRKGGYLRLGRRLNWPANSRVYMTYQYEDVRYINPDEDYLDYLISGRTSSVSLTFSRDTRDHADFASSGSRTSLEGEIAGGLLGGTLSYYRYTLNNEFYTPLFWKLSLCVRSKLGFINAYSKEATVPYSERFMPGGTSYDGFVRGYSNYQVGPRLNGEEIGGETMIVNNIEMQIPIIQGTLYGIGFYDFGNSWRTLSQTNPFDVKRSAGVGARMSIPGMGTIGLDVGYGFDKLEDDAKRSGWKTHFQFGNTF